MWLSSSFAKYWWSFEYKTFIYWKQKVCLTSEFVDRDCQYILTVHLGFCCGKVKVKKKGRHLTCWVDQQAPGECRFNTRRMWDMNIASYSHVHPQPLWSGIQELSYFIFFVCLFVWIFTAAFQMPPFFPCPSYLFLHHQFPLLCLPGAAPWFSQIELLWFILWIFPK